MKTKIEIIQKQMNTIDNVLREIESGKEESVKIKKIQKKIQNILEEQTAVEDKQRRFDILL